MSRCGVCDKGCAYCGFSVNAAFDALHLSLQRMAVEIAEIRAAPHQELERIKWAMVAQDDKVKALYDAVLAALEWFELSQGKLHGGFEVPPVAALEAAVRKADGE